MRNPEDCMKCKIEMDTKDKKIKAFELESSCLRKANESLHNKTSEYKAEIAKLAKSEADLKKELHKAQEEIDSMLSKDRTAGYIVFNPKGSHPPRKIHLNKTEAVSEASRLAKDGRDGLRYLVAKIENEVVAVETVVRDITVSNFIPSLKEVLF